MFDQMHIHRQVELGLTTLELRGPDSELQLKLLSRLNKRDRRIFMRAFLSQIRPWLAHYQTPLITHSDRGILRERVSNRYRLVPFRSSSFDLLPGVLGHEIRRKRSELGLTQAMLARELGIQRSHVSDLERGIYLPNVGTRGRLEKILGLKFEAATEKTDGRLSGKTRHASETRP